MEMTNRRWAALVVLSCAALAALKLPPNERAHWLDWEQRARSVNQSTIAANLNRRLQDLDETATLIARRDSLLAAARTNASRVTPLVVTSAKVSEGERRIIEKAVRDQQKAIGGDGRSLLVSVARDTIGSTPKRLSYRTERQFILPAATDGESCITIVLIGRARREPDSDDLAGILGPCAFYAAFGPPGPGVESWLRRRLYDVALNAVWPARADSNPGLMVPRKATRKEELEQWLDFGRSYRLLDATGCSSGDQQLCARLVRAALKSRQSTVPDGLVLEYRDWGSITNLGPSGSVFLADLLAEQGREKFARFWRSPLEMEVAFKEAFGESTGDWTMRWMRYRYGVARRGPYIAPGSALLSILTSVGLVGLCAAMATRRQTE